jgi:hypothetical protein
MEMMQRMTENLGSDMERSIISAHKKYFEGNSETLVSLNDAEAALYNTVIRYFMDTF